MASCDVRGTVLLIESSRQLRCHCPAKSSIFTTPRRCTDDKQFTKLGHQRSCCCIDDVLQEDRTHKKVVVEGLSSIDESAFVSGLPCCSQVVVQIKASCFSGVELNSSPTAPTRVPLNKEGAAAIGRPQTIAIRVYIGSPTAIRSQFRFSSSSSSRQFDTKDCSSPDFCDFGSGRLDHFRRNRTSRVYDEGSSRGAVPGRIYEISAVLLLPSD